MAKRVDGSTTCFRCGKATEYHLSTTRLYGVEMLPRKICNECDYAIQARGLVFADDRDAGFCPGCGHTERNCTCDEPYV